MAVTSGFFNALNGDRKYFARQMAEMFMGVLGEGVFATIGTAFAASISEQPNTINVGIGKSWFKNMWIYNDSILPVVLPESELLLDRWDAIILDHNNNEDVRDGTIFVVKGIPSSSPVYPDLTRTQYHDQRATTYIFRPANSSEILQEHVKNNVGMEDCPFITGFLETVDVEVFLQQWNDKTEEKLAELQEAIDNIIVGASVMLKEEFQALQQEPGIVDKSAFAPTNPEVTTHILNKANPHGVTKSQVGLGNVANVSALPLAGGTINGQLVVGSELIGRSWLLANQHGASTYLYIGRGSGYYGINTNDAGMYVCTHTMFRVMNISANSYIPITANHLITNASNEPWVFGKLSSLSNSLSSNGVSTILGTAFTFRIMTRNASTYTNAVASAFTPASSKRYKTNIKDLTLEKAKKILEFRAVEYNRIEDLQEDGSFSKGALAYGFIAEEIDEIDSTYVEYFQDVPEALDYMEMVAPLKMLVNDLYTIVNEQQTRIEALEKEVFKNDSEQAI